MAVPIGAGGDHAVEQFLSFAPPADPAGGIEVTLGPGIDEMTAPLRRGLCARSMVIRIVARRDDDRRKGKGVFGVGAKPRNSSGAFGRSTSAGATSSAPATGQP